MKTVITHLNKKVQLKSIHGGEATEVQALFFVETENPSSVHGKDRILVIDNGAVCAVCCAFCDTPSGDLFHDAYGDDKLYFASEAEALGIYESRNEYAAAV